MGMNFEMQKVESIGGAIIAKLQRRLRLIATMRAPVRAAASLQHQSDVRERRRLPVQYVLLPIGPEMMAFAPKSVIPLSSTVPSDQDT